MSKDAVWLHLISAFSQEYPVSPKSLVKPRTIDLIILSNFQPVSTMYLYSYSSVHFHVLSVFPLSPCFSPPRATCISSSSHTIYPIHFFSFSCSWIYGEVSMKSMTAVMLLEVPCSGGWIGSRQKGSHVDSHLVPWDITAWWLSHIQTSTSMKIWKSLYLYMSDFLSNQVEIEQWLQ